MFFRHVQISAPICNAVYIEERNFVIKYLSAFKKKHPEKWNFAKHLLDSNHYATFNNKHKLRITCIYDHFNKLI